TVAFVFLYLITVITLITTILVILFSDFLFGGNLSFSHLLYFFLGNCYNFFRSRCRSLFVRLVFLLLLDRSFIFVLVVSLSIFRLFLFNFLFFRTCRSGPTSSCTFNRLGLCCLLVKYLVNQFVFF